MRRRVPLFPALAGAAGALILAAGAFRTGRYVPLAATGSGTVLAAPDDPGTAAPLPLDLSRAELTRAILDGLAKRVMGRRESSRNIERVVRDVAPIVDRAARQPPVERVLLRIARDEGISFEDARERWVRLHEADLLLESGGDPEAVSVSAAVGVAQWLAATARANGLVVDVAASRRLTAAIDERKRQIAWREYLLTPGADPRAPGVPAGLTPTNTAAGLPGLRAELGSLRAARRRVDARYDPEAAIRAQARYLARLYARFPSLDWVYQAYHGGENGVARTLQRYLGRSWPGSPAAAIRSGGPHGGRLSFEDLYHTTTPRARPEAFDYLYGRSDDHRHYWWKLRAAREAIALRRRDPDGFRRRWEAFLPGRFAEAAWYPDGPAEVFRDLAELRAAHAGKLSPVTSGPLLPYALRVAPLDAGNARWYAALRPEAKGTLLLVAAAYRQAGGTGALAVGDLVLTREYVDRARAREPASVAARGAPWPPPTDAGTLPGGGPPEDFDFHTTGIALDLLKPADPGRRKRLDYALGFLEDRRIVWRTDKKAGERGQPPHYHVVPNPRHAGTLSRIAASGRVPPLPAGL